MVYIDRIAWEDAIKGLGQCEATNNSWVEANFTRAAFTGHSFRPRPHVSGYFWIRNFFFPDTVSVHKYPVNPTDESATFLIRSPGWKFLKTLWIWNRVDARSGHFFLSGDLKRLSPVVYREYCIQDGNLVSSVSLLPIFTMQDLLPILPVKSWVLQWIQILVGYVWRGKFYLNTDTCGRGNFESEQKS